MGAQNTRINNVSIRTKIKTEKGLTYRIARQIYYTFQNIRLPVPQGVCVMMWKSVSFLIKAYYWGKSVFWVTPLYRGLCFRIGKNFRSGTFVPYVEGVGKIYVGDNVRFDGRQNYFYASIRDEIPEIHIGDNTGVGHNVVFDIAGKLTIGNNCLIASGVLFVDCGGHSILPEKREAGESPEEKDVRDITIGNNVWIGIGAFIMPGAIIGNNCVIAPNTTVSQRIPQESMVYTSPAKVVQIRNISKVI